MNTQIINALDRIAATARRNQDNWRALFALLDLSGGSELLPRDETMRSLEALKSALMGQCQVVTEALHMLNVDIHMPPVRLTSHGDIVLMNPLKPLLTSASTRHGAAFVAALDLYTRAIDTRDERTAQSLMDEAWLTLCDAANAHHQEVAA